MSVDATVPVASVGVKRPLQFCMMESTASRPTSTAQVTIQRTISRRRQFSDDVSVMRITCSPSWNPTFSRAGIRAVASAGRGASLGGAGAGGKVSPGAEEAAGGGVGGKA